MVGVGWRVSPTGTTTTALRRQGVGGKRSQASLGTSTWTSSRTFTRALCGLCPHGNAWEGSPPSLALHSCCRQITIKQTHKHTNTQTHRHTNAQTHKHTNTQTREHANTQTRKRTNTQTRKHTNTQTHKCRNTQTQRKHTNTQKRKHKHTITQTHKHSNTQVANTEVRPTRSS
jgi:hypothetical protein